MSLLDWFRGLFSRSADRVEPRHGANDVDDDVEAAPGWLAIDGALAPLYGDQTPLHWGTVISWMLGGRDPLDGISGYRNDGPPLHWHFVSYGMSELYGKESKDVDVSGWGFELTFRLAREAADETPPMWPLSLLQNLGRYMFDSGNSFGAGHHLDCNGPIALEAETDLVALLFLPDPQLDPIDTPHGRVQFLQLVGITADELEACRAWNTESFGGVLKKSNPLLVTDLRRKSILSDPLLLAEVEEGRSRDGSSSAVSLTLSWRKDGRGYVVTINANGAAALPTYVQGRLEHGYDLMLSGPQQQVMLRPGETSSASADGELLNITLGQEARAMMRSVAAQRGRYEIEGTDLVIEVVTARILDQDGNVVDEIG